MDVRRSGVYKERRSSLYTAETEKTVCHDVVYLYYSKIFKTKNSSIEAKAVKEGEILLPKIEEIFLSADD